MISVNARNFHRIAIPETPILYYNRVHCIELVMWGKIKNTTKINSFIQNIKVSTLPTKIQI